MHLALKRARYDEREDEKKVTMTQCLVELYLEQLESTARPSSVQEVLQKLANNWRMERGIPSFWFDESGISLADISDDLAMFFLIALVPAETFDDSVVEAVTENAGAGFAGMMFVFLERGIVTDFLTLNNPCVAPSYLYWAESRQHSALAALLRNRGIKTESEYPAPEIAWGKPILSWESEDSSDVYTGSSAASQATVSRENDSDGRSIGSSGTHDGPLQ
jgi:hypothetical protein